MIFIILPIIIIALYFILNKTKLVKYNKNNLTFCVIIFIIFTLLQGLRGYGIGTDTNHYVDLYNNVIKHSSLWDILTKKEVNFEIGFGLLVKIMSMLWIPARGFLVIVAIIINGGLAYFVYKNSKNPLLSIIIFMGAEYFNLSFTALRQMIAVVIILNTYSFIKQGKKKEALCLIILAATFHTTALIFLPVLFYDKIKINKNFVIILIAVFIAIQIIGMPILEFLLKDTYYARYIGTGTTGQGMTQLLVIVIYTALGVLLAYKNNKQDEYKILIMLMITAIYIQSFTPKIQLMGRLIWYFYIFNMIYLPNLINEVNKTKEKNYLNLLVGGLSIAQYVLFSSKMYNVEPYSFL